MAKECDLKSDELSPATEKFILEATSLVLALQTKMTMLRSGADSIGEDETLEGWLSRRYDHFP